MRISKKWLLAGALAATTLTTPACYGPFNLTQRYHHWNGTVDGKWGNEAVYFFTGPIYGFCAFADSLIFNSIEFWTGNNPIAPPGADAKMKGALDAPHTFEMAKLPDGRIELTVLENGQKLGSCFLSTENLPGDGNNGRSASLVDAQGNVLGVAERQEDGSIILVAAR